MGLEDMIKDGENAVDGQTSANDQSQNQQSGSGNESKYDTVADSAVDEFASNEGLSAALDPEVNNVVNDEINKL